MFLDYTEVKEQWLVRLSSQQLYVVDRPVSFNQRGGLWIASGMPMPLGNPEDEPMGRKIEFSAKVVKGVIYIRHQLLTGDYAEVKLELLYNDY